MSNRLLSILILVLFFGAIYGVYYYFFVANVGNLTFALGGATEARIELVSEFKNTYSVDCQKTCTLANIPPVRYSIQATASGGFLPISQEFTLGRGEGRTINLAFERQVTTTEAAPEKSDAIDIIRLKNTIIEAFSGSAEIIGYRRPYMYYTASSGGTLDIIRQDTTGSGLVVSFMSNLPDFVSLDTYEWYITTHSRTTYSFLSLSGSDSWSFESSDVLYSIKNTDKQNLKVVTTDKWVGTYDTDMREFSINPLYDDILVLPSGKVLALIRKNSADKRSLLNLENEKQDLILLLDIDTKERTIVLRTDDNGKNLTMQDKKIYLVNMDGKKSELQNVE